MDLKQIAFFVRVADLGSFTRASIALGVSQPALSRQVRLLETELRQTLLHRNGRGVVLTEAGECFVQHAQPVLDAVQRMGSAMEALRTEPDGRVVVGLPSRIARVLNKPLVNAFRTRFPNAKLTIAEGLSNVVDEWLKLGRVELAILIDPAHGAELDCELLHSEELVLVGPAGARQLPDALPLREISRYPLVLPRPPNATRTALEVAARRIGVHLSICLEVDTVQGVLELVEGRVGFGFLPIGAVPGRGCGSFRVTRIQSPAVRHHLFLAQSRHGQHSRLAREVAQLIRAQDLPELLG